MSLLKKIALAASAFALATVTLASDFPVTIEHKYGEITLTEKPLRVVSVGYSDQDDILAFGVKPVAIRDWYGDQPNAVWPWAQDELGDAEPVVLGAGSLDFEAIAKLNPDLIIGVSSGMKKKDYTKLSKIAPTLPQSGDFVDWGVPWDERTRVIGKALGYGEKAEEMITSINDRVKSIADAHPEFKGKTAAVAFYWSGSPGAYASQDTRSRLMQELGFSIPGEYDEMASDAFYASFSEERLDLLNVDALLWLDAEVDKIKLRKQMDFYKKGNEVLIGTELGGAFSFMSPLSIGYLLDNLIPEIEKAIDGDPETVVPSTLAKK